MAKRISILGSTGSIGKNTLKVAQHLGKDFVQVKALAAKSNIDLLEEQARAFHPSIIAVYDKEKAFNLQKRLPHIRVVGGLEGVEEAASCDEVDFTVSAMSGTLGLAPTVAAITAGKSIGLANKEALVSGGALITSLARKRQVDLIPIDSEHCAIFQCLKGEDVSAVNRLIITSSGGPFLHFSKQQLASVSVDEALKHPTWKMGPKITIDSSTLMNKGLEVIEAYWLFGIPLDKIDVVIHPQSIIHSMVEFVDTSILAQMGEPSMIVPIQYALTYPERMKGLPKPFDFLKNSTLQFQLPDTEKFPCLRLAYEGLKAGGDLTCYMNAANEVLVHRFLNREFTWQEISLKLERLMQDHPIKEIVSLEDIFATDTLAREEAATI